MKSLVPWICLLAATASQQIFAEDDFKAYRLGNYNNAAGPLINKQEKDALANYYLGRMYLYGYGQLKNNNLALRYFTKAAEKGYLPAILVMAKYSLLQEKNPEQAVKWFKKAASEGDVNAQLFMASAYLYGVGVKKNVDIARKFYIDAAKNGNSIAQFALAENFLEGRHSGNSKLGVIWLTKSAAQDNPKALTLLGSLSISGKWVEQDREKGIEMLTKAASQNYTPAMVKLGKVFIKEKDYPKGMEWFKKAASQNDLNAYLQIAHVYLDEKSPVHDVKEGYSWTLKAAQDGLLDAKTELADLYKNGTGVSANADIAKQWADQAASEEKSKPKVSPLDLAALWLSNGVTNKLEQTSYQPGGIFSDWQNTSVLRDSTYNQSPKLQEVTRHDLFKPQFELIQPNEVPINYYYDAMVNKNVEFQPNQWTYPLYPLNQYVETEEHANSLVLNKSTIPIPYLDANYEVSAVSENNSLINHWTEEWEKQANYSVLFNHLYFRALLGDAQCQFEIGQMFQYGLGVQQNHESAIIFYQNAAAQQHLGAEYNLGILYLQDAKDNNDYQIALNWLTDSAFKGNSRAQYVLSRLLSQGIAGKDGVMYIKPNNEQAMSMLYLSAANDYGPAEYDLAEYLARQYDNGLSVTVKKHKLALIHQLYQGAADKGVVQALLPLAFYDAMDHDKQRQDEAFLIAERQALSDDPKAALLLGLLYDRGIGTHADPAKAMYWYQQAGQNPVTQFILGTYTREGKGIPANKEKGTDLLMQSAAAQFSYADFNLAVLEHTAEKEFLPALIKAYELGNSHAGIVLADYYLAANEDSKQMNEAREIYKGLAEKGDQYAQLKFAYMLEHGLGADPNPMEAEHWYLASAEQGNPEAQYLLGQYYQLGENGEPQYQLAKAWYQKAAAQLPKAYVALGFINETVDDNYSDALKSYEQAAEKGDAIGIYDIALMYEYGKGMPVAYQKAKSLYIEAANHGSSDAMNQLAGIYFYGLGEHRDIHQGLHWYKKAASLGNSNALYQLGLLSETGVATKLDFSNALKYYQEASDKGNEKAMLALARMYHYGLGVEKDPKKSAVLYEKLASVQNAYAQYQLGTYYLEGIAGEKSPEKGRQLLEQASENGSLQARKVLQRIEAKNQARVSYVEPVLFKQLPEFKGKSADLIYLEALNEWNKGDELLSRMLLQRLVTQYPNYVPAKRIYEQLNQAKRASFYS